MYTNQSNNYETSIMTIPTLKELLSGYDESVPMSEEEKNWDRMKPVGKEFGSLEQLSTQDKIAEDIELASIIEDRKDQEEIEINIEEL